jgi:hypothetical protein
MATRTRVTAGVIVAAPAKAALSRLDFRWRLSLAEQIAVKRAELEHPDANTRATLSILRESLAEVTDAAGVDVTDLRTQGGAAAIVDVLVGAGLVAGAGAAARLAALLTPPADV